MNIKCDNCLYVCSTNAKQLKQFKKDVQDKTSEECFVLGNIIPSPDGADKDWYEKNWGTDRISGSTLTYQNDKMLNYQFVSDDFPPTSWLRKIGPLYPDLYFFMKFKDENFTSYGGWIVKNEKYDAIKLDDASFFSLLIRFSKAEFAPTSEELGMFTFNVAKCDPLFDLIFGRSKQWNFIGGIAPESSNDAGKQIKT